MKTKQLIIEKTSPFDVATTVEKLIEAASIKGWQNPATHNFEQSLAKSGKVVRPIQVVEICKPEYSGNMLEKSDERIVSIMMPCRLSVYEKEDGKVYVALLNMAEISIGLPEAAIKAIDEATAESFDIVNAVIGIN
jgi:uncharacterized protein (DUF302 family)